MSDRTMNLNDRCDRCQHSAYVKATVHGVDLLFCGHHFSKHELELSVAADDIVDERSFIEPEPSIFAARTPTSPKGRL
jgi:hypothetical protein